jgi:hypothetical protein
MAETQEKVKLPTGMTEFENWAKSIIAMTDLPDNDSMRFALASAIWGLKPHEGHVPLEYFAEVLIKGAASQVAGQVLQDLKAKQQAEIEAAKAAATAKAAEETAASYVPPAEATAPQTAVASDGQKI